MMKNIPTYFYVLLFVSMGALLIMKYVLNTNCPQIRAKNFQSLATDTKDNNNVVARMNTIALTKGRDKNGIIPEKYQIKNKILFVPELDTIIKGGIKNVGNLPTYSFVMGHNGQTFLNNASCAPFPAVLDIRFTDTYWQTQIAPNWTFHVFNAYWDNRELNLGGPSVRILGYADRSLKNATMHCQIWFEKETMPRIAKVVEYDVTWFSEDGVANTEFKYVVVPYLLNCPLHIEKNETAVPVSVSIVEEICDRATTNVKIHYEKPLKKEKVAVCVRTMNFPFMDLSIRLVEWLEVLKLFGVHKVFLYERNVHPNISKVIEHYADSKFVEVAKVTLAGGFPNEVLLSKAYDFAGRQSLITEILPINDCLYKNLYNYDHLAVIDIDEFFVPSKSESWTELLQDLERNYSKDVSSLAFQHTIFYPEVKLDKDAQEEYGIPPFLNFVQEVYRACASFPRARMGAGWTKCFHNPLKVKLLHNHYPFKCLKECNTVEVDESYGDLHHHRFGKLKQVFCPNDTFIIDKTLWKWKHKIIDRTTLVLKKLNLI